jgi:hypothetical protein
MSNFLPPSMEEHSETDDQYTPQAERQIKSFSPDAREEPGQRDQMRLEHLMTSGFTWKESVNLVNLREHLYENVEMRQCMEIDPRMQFARWLHEHHEISEYLVS